MGDKFAASVVDTGGAPWLANISAKFLKKFETVQMEYSEAGGKPIHEKNQKQKILWHCPFKRYRRCSRQIGKDGSNFARKS
jgi:hypothetical protein